MILSVFAMAAAMVGGADGGALKEYPGGWSLYKNDNNCALMRSYDKDTVLHVAYYAGKGSTRVSVLDPALKSVTNDAKLSYKLVFLKDKNLDTGWGTINATGMVLSDGSHGFSFGTTGSTFLDDMGKNDLFGLMDGETVIESLKLDQVSTPLDGLKQCAATVAVK